MAIAGKQRQAKLPAPSPGTPLLRSRQRDRTRGRYPDPTVCPRCDVVLRDGEWRWGMPPEGAFWILCPACRRIDEDYPAGIVALSGPFVATHPAEILDLVRNEEIAERDERPLSRLMGLSEGPGGMDARTTDTHLGQRIGEALQRAFGGELAVRYSEDDAQVRVRWAR